MNRWLKNSFKRLLFFIFKLFSRLGIHVLPVHYYSSLPNIHELESKLDIWAKPSSLPGLDFDLDKQVDNLKEICKPYIAEYEKNSAYDFAVKNQFGPGYGGVEAQALHAVVRHFKPKKVLEVGSGVSTWCMLEALKLNQSESGCEFSLTCIEPYPSDKLKSLGDIQLITKQVQAVGFDEAFGELEENDFLFIDSSHTVKPGSDVNYLVLEVLPMLKPGVVVHFHDIFLPYDYQPTALQSFFYWMETSLVRAFLANNSRAQCIFCQSHLHYERVDAMKEVFPGYTPCRMDNGLFESSRKPFNELDGHFPSSLYLKL